jgi:hypothetical protein
MRSELHVSPQSSPSANVSDLIQARLQSNISNPNRWAARSRSNQLRRLRWEPPKEGDLQRTASLTSYKNKSRVLGNASAEDIDRMTASLTIGPSPPPETSPASSTRLTRFFGRANKPTNSPATPTSAQNPESLDVISEKAANQHWYSNLLRRGPQSRSVRSDQSSEALPAYVQSPVELHSSPVIAELMADQQLPVELPVELPASLPSSAAEKGPPIWGEFPVGNVTTPPPQYTQTQPRQPESIHMPIPLLMRRPPTVEDAPPSMISVSPVGSAMTDRARSVVSRTSPSPNRQSTSRRK